MATPGARRPGPAICTAITPNAPCGRSQQSRARGPILRTRSVTSLNHLGMVPITIGMTLFPSAFRSDRLWATGTPAHPLRGLRNVIKQLLLRPPSITAPALSVVPTHANGTRRHRPEPRPKWTDPRRAPDGDFAASAILNVELASTGVPRRGTSWDVMSDFALSYDGYGYWDDLHELANRVVQRWTRSRMLPESLDELRGMPLLRATSLASLRRGPQRSLRRVHVGHRRRHLRSRHPDQSGHPDQRGHPGHRGRPCDGAQPRRRRRAPPRRAPTDDGHRGPREARGVSRFARGRGTACADHAAGSGRHGTTRSHGLGRDPRAPGVVDRECAGGQTPVGRAPRRSSEHPAMQLSDHPSPTKIRDLRPMPSAEPLPKPPVIVRRTRNASGAANRPGGAVHATRSSSDAHPSNGARRRLEPVPDPSPAPAAAVTPSYQEFRHDDAGYLTWVENHPEGYVLNQPRTARSKTPTLHRASCAAVACRGETEALTAGPAKVCGPSAEALEAWSAAQGTGRPTVCRRCCP